MICCCGDGQCFKEGPERWGTQGCLLIYLWAGAKKEAGNSQLPLSRRDIGIIVSTELLAAWFATVLSALNVSLLLSQVISETNPPIQRTNSACSYFRTKECFPSSVFPGRKGITSSFQTKAVWHQILALSEDLRESPPFSGSWLVCLSTSSQLSQV